MIPHFSCETPKCSLEFTMRDEAAAAVDAPTAAKNSVRWTESLAAARQEDGMRRDKVLVSADSPRQKSSTAAAASQQSPPWQRQGRSSTPWSNATQQPPRHSTTRALLEVPMRYNCYNESTTNKSSNLNDSNSTAFKWGLLESSRLVTVSTIPILLHSAAVSSSPTRTPRKIKIRSSNGREDNDQVDCQVALTSGIRGRTGYTNGSVDVHWRMTGGGGGECSSAVWAEPSASTNTTRRRTTTVVTAGLGMQPLPLPNNNNNNTALANTTTPLNGSPNETTTDVAPMVQIPTNSLLTTMRMGISSHCQTSSSSTAGSSFHAAKSTTPQLQQNVSTSTTNSSTAVAAHMHWPLDSIHSRPPSLVVSTTVQRPILLPPLLLLPLGTFLLPPPGPRTTNVPPPLSPLRLQAQCSASATARSLSVVRPHVLSTVHGTLSWPLGKRQRSWCTLRCGLQHQTQRHTSTQPFWRPHLAWSVQSISIPNLLPNLGATAAAADRPDRRGRGKLLDVSVQWKGASSWHFSGCWRSPPPPPPPPSADAGNSLTSPSRPQRLPRRSIGIGVTIQTGPSSSKNSTGSSTLLQWIFTWTEGDFTLRIPIQWVVGAAAGSTSTLASSILYQQAFQYLYLSVWSNILQDVIGHLIPVETSHESNEPDLNRLELGHEKARTEALLQQSFMERQARIRTAAEQERKGLVIHRAVYYARHRTIAQADSTGTDRLGGIPGAGLIVESLDVTIPLQFWVVPNESRLELYGAFRRGSLLGFYDIAASIRTKSKPVVTTSETTTDSPHLHWTQRLQSLFWNATETETPPANEEVIDDLGPAKSDVADVVAELYIHYNYKGCSYQVTIGDDEDLVLPTGAEQCSIE
jgi:Domain of unknown function (DUF3395)